MAKNWLRKRRAKERRLPLMRKWILCRTSFALRIYREAIAAGLAPTAEELSQVLGCLKLPHDVNLRDRLVENLGVSTNPSKGSNICSLVDGFGEYDPRAFSLLEVCKHKWMSMFHIPDFRLPEKVSKLAGGCFTWDCSGCVFKAKPNYCWCEEFAGSYSWGMIQF